MMSDDAELLRRYLGGDDPAFTELVRRHVNVVHAAALRRVGFDHGLAEEVTQAVFAQCARKAARLVRHPTLAGWLHRSTRFAAIDVLRARRRRAALEERHAMDSATGQAEATDRAWAEIRPLIDALIDRLGERERAVLLLRFFEGRSFAEIGRLVGTSEDAARMRVERALAKLRGALHRRGVQSSGAALAGALAAHAAPEAGAGLAEGIAATALAGTPVGVAAATWGSVLLMNKLSLGLMAAVVGGGLVAIVGETRASRALAREAETLRSRAGGRATPAPAVVEAIADSAELTRLRGRVAELKARPDGVAESAILRRADLRNVGYATPEAAFETLAWAAFARDFDVFAQGFSFGKSKPEADAYFASLPPDVQAKYRTPERLFAPFVAAIPGRRANIDAMQVIEQFPGDRPDEVSVRAWFHNADGDGHIGLMGFSRIGDHWVLGNRNVGLSLGQGTKWLRENVDATLPELETEP